MNEQVVLEKIIKLVKKSGKIILEADRSSLGIDGKEGHGNFVTMYDKKVQEVLFKGLNKILPEATLVGEEDIEHAEITDGYTFVVDPIDGTTNFINDYKASAISIGLLKDKKEYMGVVYNPYLDEVFYAIKDWGAYCNGKSIHVTDRPLSEGIVLFGSAPYYEELNDATFALARTYLEKSVDLRRSGSAAIDLCNVAAGRADVFFELRLCPWDYCAGSIIIQEAGGVCVGLDKQPLTFDKNQGVLAANKLETLL